MLAGCSQPNPATVAADSPGGKLESAALAHGLVPDPTASIIGAWARDTDRVCVVPGRAGGDLAIGALVDYGEGQGCAASGIVKRSGGRLDIRFGACRMTATFDGDRIVFPPEVPAAVRPAMHRPRVACRASGRSAKRIGIGSRDAPDARRTIPVPRLTYT